LTAPDVETHASQQARLAEQLITAEQDERRRLALFLHDGPVQSLSGIALMLDAVRHAIDEGRLDDAHQILETALERHRDTIRSLRDLSFNPSLSSSATRASRQPCRDSPSGSASPRRSRSTSTSSPARA